MKNFKIKLNMKRLNYLFIVLFFVLTVVGTFFVVKNKFGKKDILDELININELDDEFMDKYYSDMNQLLVSENRDNVLVVVSKTEPKNNYGAINVVNAPNSIYIYEYKSEKAKDKAKKDFEKDKSIYSVVENRKYKFSDDSNNSVNYNSWGIEKAGLDHAIQYVSQNGGESVTAAIIDTGCDMELFNESFQGKIEEVYNLYEPDIYGNDSMFDHFGHGTHIAGTIAEGTPNNVKILPVKVSDGDSLDTVAILDAITYITDYHKADVINMSFGAPVPEITIDPEYIVIEAAKRENIISVAAAGNSNSEVLEVPGAFDNTLSISAVDSELNRADFSSYNDTVTFAAPGVDILSINGVKSGTSMATPHAVCSVAFLKSIRKNLSFESVIESLRQNVIDLGTEGRDKYFGYGFIDLSNFELCSGDNNESCTYLTGKKEVVPTAIEVEEVITTPYNYGSLTNVLPTKLRIIGDNDDYIIETLDKLSDVTISGYDPYASGEQTVNISYLDFSTSFKVSNPDNYELGWITRNKYDNTGNPTDEYDIIGYLDNNLGLKKLYFPQTIDGHNVVGIEYGLAEKPYVFGDSSDAINYREVYLPSNIRTIGTGAFKKLKRLNKIKSDAEDIYVGSVAFEELNFLETVDANVIINEGSHAAFYNNYSLRNITLSSKTTVITNSVFLGCKFLKNIELPSGVTKINSSAFYGSGLKSITLPEGLKRIETGAFVSTYIKEVNIPASVNYIGEYAFGSSSLNSISVSEGNSVYDSRNDCNAVIESSTDTLVVGSSSTVIPDGIKKIARSAFRNSSIESVEIPSSVNEIGEYAFYACDELDRAVIPKNISSIPDNAFEYAGYNRPFRIKFYVHSSSYAQQYAIKNRKAYVLVDETPSPSEITNMLFNGKTSYLPFDQLDISSYSAELVFNGIDEHEIITNFRNPVYENGRDSLRYGDWSALLYFDSSYGYHNLEMSIPVDVGKLVPEYEIPTDIYANVNSTLADVDLPDGFEWEDSSILISETGNKVYDAKYIPTDSNYDVVNNIAIPVHVIDKQLIKPTISVTGREYDETKDLSLDNISITGIDENDYEIIDAGIDDKNAGMRNALITLRLSNDKYNSYSFSNGKQEKIFKCQMMITPKKIERPTPVSKEYVYDGDDQFFELENYNNKAMNIIGNKQKDAGTYTVIITLKSNNYQFLPSSNTPQMGGSGGYGGSAGYSFSSSYNPETSLYYQFVIKKGDIYYNGSDRTYTYDGIKHGIELYAQYDCNIKYMDDHGNYTLDEMPMYSEVGTYTIKYMLTAGDNYNVKYGENTLTIIQDDTFIKKDNMIIVGVTTYTSVVNRLSSNSGGNNFKHYNKDEELVDSEQIKTGDIIRNENISNSEYHIVVLGDTSGDGKINYLDYVNIYNHIQKEKHPLSNKNKLQDVYYEAGDFNRDGSISYLDYVQLFKKISDNKGGETE